MAATRSVARRPQHEQSGDEPASSAPPPEVEPSTSPPQAAVVAESAANVEQINRARFRQEIACSRQQNPHGADTGSVWIPQSTSSGSADTVGPAAFATPTGDLWANYTRSDGGFFVSETVGAPHSKGNRNLVKNIFHSFARGVARKLLAQFKIDPDPDFDMDSWLLEHCDVEQYEISRRASEKKHAASHLVRKKPLASKLEREHITAAAGSCKLLLKLLLEHTEWTGGDTSGVTWRDGPSDWFRHFHRQVHVDEHKSEDRIADIYSDDEAADDSSSADTAEESSSV